MADLSVLRWAVWLLYKSAARMVNFWAVEQGVMIEMTRISPRAYQWVVMKADR